MIELRYLEYEYIHRSPVLPSLDWTEIKLKLQYRQKEGPKGEQWWSEWIDVPTVKVS